MPQEIILAVIGVENAYPIGEDLRRVKEFYDRGGRYMSLAHNGNIVNADTLRADLESQGITFETSNKDDAFTVALTDLDTFEIDYMDKNLKIKLKGGKQYNFTDPDGNADRLFVFQRDVDKARQRLGKGDQPAAN